MGFVESVQTCFKKYTTFSGAASRSEYWRFVLFAALGSTLMALTGIAALRVIWVLATFLPGLAVAVRRHHDAGRSGWWLLASLVWPWELVLLCYPSKLTANKYVADRVAQFDVTEASITSTGQHCGACGKLQLPGQNYCTGCGKQLSGS